MKKILLVIIVITFGHVFTTWAENGSKDKHVPDIPGYYTLKCDLHMHTVFSDGKVWPTVRVDEAIKEGLDAIALSDHIGKQKPDTDVKKDLNRAYDIALIEAKGSDLLVIKGAEITFPVPPGHVNSLFLTDAEKLDTKTYQEAYDEAKKQDAFFFWNHSNWKSPDKKYEQDGIAQWFDVHTEMLKNGMLQGLEIVNAHNYNLEAHNWCLEKNLTLLGNTDIHQPITFEYDLDNSHRTMTLVFAKERSVAGIKEALLNRRTAVWFENMVIGDEAFLEPLFQNSVKVTGVTYYEKIADVTLKNNSDIDFILENNGEYSFFNKTKLIVLKAGEEMHLGVKTGDVKKQFQLKFLVKNFLTTPEDCLGTVVDCKVD